MPINTNFQQTPGPRFFSGNVRPTALDRAYTPRHPSESVIMNRGVPGPGPRIPTKFAPGNAVERMKRNLNRQ